MEQGWEIGDRARDLDLLLRVHNALPSTLMDYAPDYERGWRILMDGIELSRRSGRRTHEAWMWSNVGNYAFDLGRIDDLERASEMCIEIGRAHANPYALGAGSMGGAQAAFLRDDLVLARSLVEQAMGVLPMGEEQQAVPYQSLTAGWIARASGDEDGELRWYLDGLELLGDELMIGMADELLSETARALARRGRDEEAAPLLERLRPVARERPNAEAFLWWAEGVLEREPAKLHAAAERFAELTRPIDEGRVLLDLADLGEDPEANRARARELFAACGAEVYVRQVAAAAGS
jgi:hypothetical protein